MAHEHSLKISPADLDRLHGVMTRAGVADVSRAYLHPFELLADIEALARQLASVRLRGAVESAARDSLRTLADNAVDHLGGHYSARMLADDVLRAARHTLGDRPGDTPGTTATR